MLSLRLQESGCSSRLQCPHLGHLYKKKWEEWCQKHKFFLIKKAEVFVRALIRDLYYFHCPKLCYKGACKIECLVRHTDALHKIRVMLVREMGHLTLYRQLTMSATSIYFCLFIYLFIYLLLLFKYSYLHFQKVWGQKKVGRLMVPHVLMKARIVKQLICRQ